jgi:hypothetical protein
VIRDAAAWEKLVAADKNLAKLKIDFATQMVVVYAEGSQGRGKHLISATVQDQGNHLEIGLNFITDLPNIPHTDDLIWPNHFLVVDRSDKPVTFKEHFFKTINPVVPLGPAAELVAAQPKLTITVDGADIVVSTQVTANASPHVLQTSYQVDSNGKIHLKYVLIQNADLLVRSQKQITVTWRLKGMAVIPVGAPFTYHVEPTNLTLSTADLANLLPQLEGLKNAGDNFKNAVAN